MVWYHAYPHRPFKDLCDRGWNKKFYTGRQIYRSQSAVSMQIKRLTEIVGKPLIEMEGKKIHLSPLGELVLEHAQKILKVHDAAMTAISQSELKGRVRLGAPEDYCSLFVPQILAGFARDYPDIRVDLPSMYGSPFMPEKCTVYPFLQKSEAFRLRVR